MFGNVQVIDIGEVQTGRTHHVRPATKPLGIRYSPGSRTLSLRSLLFAQVFSANSLGDSKRGKNMSNMLSAICDHPPKASFDLDGREPV
jgi:hypothetical protein